MKKINYKNNEITVVWQPELCWHTGICFSQLPEVFNPAIKKWIDPEAAGSERIIEQVKKCPSGALTFFFNDENKKQSLNIQ
jgi:putative redox protein